MQNFALNKHDMSSYKKKSFVYTKATEAFWRAYKRCVWKDVFHKPQIRRINADKKMYTFAF